MTSAAHQDSLQVLREYRNLAPWNLRDLAGLVGAILDASAVTPINAAARAQPSQRTVRFYVTRGLVSPPEGRGTAATYSYRHFLQLLWIKLRQMEGGTLAAI
ncbi:MAG TPA: MerR family transcriptional regulator, partial [Gemmatimonadales bacterium]